MKKIAIWGSLNYGNFGDDVMNVIFALHLKKIGCEPYVYRLNKELASYYDIKTTESLDELLENSLFSFIGGGSWLESRKLGDTYEQDFYDYHTKLKEHNIPFYVISIGGDRNNDFTQLTQDRVELFNSPLFQGGTVRLKGDLKTLSSLNKNISHYPDIVLLASEFFLKKKVKKSRKTKVAVTCSDKKLLDKFTKKINRYSFLFKNIEIIFMRTHLPEHKLDYEFFCAKETSITKNYHYTNLDHFFSFLSSIDLIITAKLHPGVSALSCGTPFFWIPGYDKTRAFLNSVDQSDSEYDPNKIFRPLSFLKTIKKIKNTNFIEIEKQKKEARGHLKYLTNLVNKHDK